VPRRYAFTGAPGAGKTVLLHALRDRGWHVVDEAATDVIAERQAAGVDEPWTVADFTERIAARQRSRADERSEAAVTLFDRSPLCTLALARYLGHPVGPRLDAEVAHAVATLERQVFLVRPLGFVTPTDARRISYEASLDFGDVHEQVYRGHGFTLLDVPAAPVPERVSLLEQVLSAAGATEAR
jgi:predicted ATPase